MTHSGGMQHQQCLQGVWPGGSGCSCTQVPSECAPPATCQEGTMDMLYVVTFHLWTYL